MLIPKVLNSVYFAGKKYYIRGNGNAYFDSALFSNDELRLNENALSFYFPRDKHERVAYVQIAALHVKQHLWLDIERMWSPPTLTWRRAPTANSYTINVYNSISLTPYLERKWMTITTGPNYLVFRDRTEIFLGLTDWHNQNTADTAGHKSSFA